MEPYFAPEWAVHRDQLSELCKYHFCHDDLLKSKQQHRFHQYQNSQFQLLLEYLLQIFVYYIPRKIILDFDANALCMILPSHKANQ